MVPAAGASERFGSEKMLADVAGLPLVERTVRSLLGGGVARVVAVVAPDAARVREALERIARTDVVVNPHPERGMFSSIQAGVAAASGDPILVLPGDMPFVRPETVSALLARYREAAAIVSPRWNGKRGHPVVLPGALRDEILAAPDGVTLHEVIRAHAAQRADLDVADRGVVRDVDVIQDLPPS